MNLETEIQNRIRLGVADVPGLLLWRNSIGFDSRAKVHYGLQNPGGADLIGMYRGRFLAIEVKVPGGERSPEQINFIRVVRLNGGLAGFASSVEDALDIIHGRQTT